MKKGLVIGVVLVAFSLVFAGVASAVHDLERSPRIEIKLTGSTEDGKAGLVLAKGNVRVDYKMTLTGVEPWEVVVTPRFDLPDTLTWEDAYIKVFFDSISLGMYPLGFQEDLELYDIEGTGGKPNISDVDPGIRFDIPVAPLGFNVAAATKEVGEEAVLSYGIGGSYELNGVTLDGMFASTNVVDWDWYGDYYGAEIAIDLAPLSLRGQYGGFDPETAGYKDGSGYFAEIAYSLGEELGDLTFRLTSVDKYLNNRGNPIPVPPATELKDYSKIYGEYDYPVVDGIHVIVDAAAIEPGTGAESFTQYELLLKVLL